MQAQNYKEGDWTEYFLLGHGAGAYIAAQYALRFPKKIKKLILMSPVGIPNKPKVPEGCTYDKMEKRKLDAKKSFMQWKPDWSVTSFLPGSAYSEGK